jgi:hypothetical protein
MVRLSRNQIVLVVVLGLDDDGKEDEMRSKRGENQLVLVGIFAARIFWGQTNCGVWLKPTFFNSAPTR